ncbi:MAG: PD-(D/E)XK nuclease family protein, partial [Deltaproteobacteria bacterium]|nr:PD-(D/E)XK nuclease family protein [Deltaproteobacteria bacterium]
RLLFLCGDDELPGRTRRLFSPPPEAGPPAPRSWPAPLRPRVLPPPDHLRVTSFRDYLACPFRFYLRHVLRMGAVDDRKAELDALDFGTLCHQALEAMGREEELRDCTSGERLAAFLEDRAQRWMRERFGARLSAPLRVQLDAARQRLAWAARVQARERAEGWRIEAVEHAVGGSAGATLAGVPVRGTADRIDRHLGSGRVRVLDYKTSETIRAPAQVHLGSPRAGDPPWTEAPSTKGPKRWADLQLPLYVLLLQEELGAGISAGYFHLPRAVRDTAVTAWEELDDSLLDSARTCAEGVVDAIRAGIFWPPGPPPRHDDFAELLLDAPELTVDGAWMSGMARPREEQP